MRLYGNDIDDTTTVARGRSRAGSWLEEGRLSRGTTSSARRKPQGVSRRLVGFETARPRHRAPRLAIVIDGEPSGEVTSGTQTPFLKKAIGMATSRRREAVPDREIEVTFEGAG